MLDKIDSDLLLNIDFMEMIELRHIPEEGCESFLDVINGAALPAMIRDSSSFVAMVQLSNRFLMSKKLEIFKHTSI